MSECLEAALEYAQRGWSVFPIRPGSKIPLTPRGHHSATTDEATIRSWWDRWPDAGIGIPTGPHICVVDKDPRNGGQKTMDAIIAEHGPLPNTPTVITGGGGEHLYFDPDPTFTNSTGTIGPGIDTKGFKAGENGTSGGYVLAPPTIHPNGKRYEWKADLGPDTPMAKTIPHLHPAEAKAKKPPASAPDVDFDALKRAQAYLQKIPGAIEGQGGDDATYQAACHIRDFGLSQSEAFNMLLQEFNPRCQPPWSSADLQQKVANAYSYATGAPGAKLSVQGTPLQKAPATAIVQSPATPLAPPAAAAPTPILYKIPPELLSPPGFLTSLCEWMLSFAILPQPEMTLANAIAFFGALVGRKVATPSNLRTNFYCMGVAKSGAGKEHSRTCIKKLCMDAGISDKILGGEDITSDSAIRSAVSLRKSVLFQFDEIGHLIARSTARNASGHLRHILATLTTLYSSAGTFSPGKEYADQKNHPREDITQPNVCIYGTTVPSRFYGALSPDEIRDGFLGRMLVFPASNNDPDDQWVKQVPPPKDLIHICQGWLERTDLPKAKGMITQFTENIPMTVEIDDAAEPTFKDFYKFARSRKNSASEDLGLDALWTRAAEHALKLSLLAACSESFQEPRILKSHAEWSTQLSRSLVSNLMDMAKENITDTPYGEIRNKVKNFIRKALPRGISWRELSRKFPSIEARMRHAIMEDLLSAEEIAQRDRKNTRGPKPAEFYLCD